MEGRPVHPRNSSSSQPLDNSLDTYVLQIPRDQIYRVPPPENAEIVRNLPAAPKKKKKKPCDPLYCFLYLMVAMIFVFVAIVLLILYILLHLKTPEFSITGLTFKNNSTSSASKHENSSYDVTMRVHNPNNKMSIIYGNEGNVSLLFAKDKHGLASGKYPSIAQEPNESTTVHAVLSGSDEPLPSEIQKMVNNTGKASGAPVTLSLLMSELIELKGVITTKKRMTVICEFGVNTLSSNSTKILSQQCRTDFFFEKQVSH